LLAVWAVWQQRDGPDKLFLCVALIGLTIVSNRQPQQDGEIGGLRDELYGIAGSKRASSSPASTTVTMTFVRLIPRRADLLDMARSWQTGRQTRNSEAAGVRSAQRRF
jgi:hypothetical protein